MPEPNKKIEDIFADVETKAPAPRPVRPEPQLKASPSVVPTYTPPSKKKRIWVGLSVLLLTLILIVVIVVMIMRFGLLSPQEVTPELIIEEPVASETISDPLVPEISESAVHGEDSDSDGLLDEEEKQYKTNITKFDTDSDGLSDYEEVKIYGTDPIDSDTDSDGYMDGEELKAGYNPLGSGKLLNFQSALEKLKNQ